MKKIFLVCSILASSLAFSANIVEKTNVEKINTESFIEKHETISKFKILRYNTIRVTTSCGNTYDVSFPSDWSSIDIMYWVWGFDAGNCGN